MAKFYRLEYRNMQHSLDELKSHPEFNNVMAGAYREKGRGFPSCMRGRESIGEYVVGDTWPDEAHPCWDYYEDGPLRGEHVFGFTRLEHFVAWFSNINRLFNIRKVARISEYSVPRWHIKRGKKQAVANAKYVKFEREIDLQNLLKYVKKVQKI